MLPKLTLKQRVIGFSISVGLAALFAILVSFMPFGFGWRNNSSFGGTVGCGYIGRCIWKFSLNCSIESCCICHQFSVNC